MLRLDIPITKVDAARRLVTGVATAEIADRAGEICDYASTKPLYEKWSAAISSSSGGKSFGNLRAMHGRVAAGKVTALAFNDAAKQIEIVAKVVDDAEWQKVEEGVYTGFSQGGTYARRWTGAGGETRYTADPHEISLVDLPCLAEARFEMVKSDGSHEWRPFQTTLDKAGARNSAADQERIQAMHDTSVELGALCDAQKALGFARDDVAKDIACRVDAMADRLIASLADLSKRLAAIESQPQPLPFASTPRAVARHQDGPGDPDALLADPAALSLLAIKLAQQRMR